MANKLSLDRVSQAIKDFRLPKLFLAGFWIRFLAFLFDVLVIKAIQATLLNLTPVSYTHLTLPTSDLV